MKFVLSASLILGVVLWWISRQVGAFEAPPGGPAAASPAAIEKRAVDPRLASARPAVPRPRPPPTVDVSADPVPPDASDSNPDVIAAARRTRMQAHFADQPVDRSWASAAQYALQDDLGKVAADGIRLHRVECRSSLCRAELIATSRDTAIAFLQSWLHQRTWTGPGFASHDDTNPDGSPRMIVFLGRPGTALPAPE
jgi:hypothetical protein